MNKLFLLIMVAFTISSTGNEKLVGHWFGDLEKTKNTPAFKALERQPGWVSMIAKMSVKFTADGKMTQLKAGKVVQELQYKVISEKGGVLKVTVFREGDRGENQILEIKDKTTFWQFLADKNFELIKVGNFPMVFVKK
jgi:hypothetical protein